MFLISRKKDISIDEQNDTCFIFNALYHVIIYDCMHVFQVYYKHALGHEERDNHVSMHVVWKLQHTL